MSNDQLTRIKQYQTDFCALVDADFTNPNFNYWDIAYNRYWVYGTTDSRGGDRPPVKPAQP